MTTVFSNVLNIRITPTELVLEFGSFFPDRPNVGPPSDYKPELRVVLNRAVLPSLAEGLKKAAETAQPTQPAGEPPKRTVGFNG